VPSFEVKAKLDEQKDRKTIRKILRYFIKESKIIRKNSLAKMTREQNHCGF